MSGWLYVDVLLAKSTYSPFDVATETNFLPDLQYKADTTTLQPT